MKMLSKNRVKTIVVVSAVTLLMSARTPPSLFAQTQKTDTPIAPSSTPVNAPLFVLLGDLSKKYTVSFVVEGGAEDFKTNTAAQPADPLAKDDLVSQIATICRDYDVSWQREGNVYLLFRQYKTLDSLPGLTLSEVDKIAQEITRLMVAHRSSLGERHISENPVFASFYNSFSPDQIKQMQGNSVPGRHSLSVPVEQAIPVGALSPDQQATVKSIIQRIYLKDTAADASQSQKEIARLLREGADFCWRDQAGVRSFGCEISLRDAKGNRIFLPLSDPGWVRRMSNGLIVSQEAMASGKDAPSAAPVTAVIPVAPASVSSSDTLKTAAEKAARKDNNSVVLAEELEEKPVVVIGEVNASPDTELRALCAAYGLRMRTIKENQSDTHTISRFPTATTSTISSLHGAILAAIPAPFFRVLTAADTGPRTTPSEDAGKGDFSSTDNKLPAVSSSKKVPEEAFDRRLTLIRSAASRKLRSTLEAKVAASPTQKVPLKELTSAERTALANVLMVDYLTSLQFALNKPVPNAIANYEKTAIVCQKTSIQGRPGFYIAFCSPVAGDSRLVTGMGMSVVDRSTPLVSP